jgi:hypothetical protein
LIETPTLTIAGAAGDASSSVSASANAAGTIQWMLLAGLCVHRLCMVYLPAAENAAVLSVDSTGQESGYETKGFTLNAG